MKVWIDDIRCPQKFTGQKDIIWFKTYETGVSAIEDNVDSVTHIYLDNDLADEQDRQGRHILNLIEELVFFNKIPNLVEIYVHSDSS